MFHPKGKEELKRMRVSSHQVKFIKCSNEISCWGNDNGYHFKGILSFVLNGFVFFAQFPKANEIRNHLLMMSILYVLVRRSYLVQQKKLLSR